MMKRTLKFLQTKRTAITLQWAINTPQTPQSKVTDDVRNFYNNSGPGGGKDRNWLLASQGGVADSILERFPESTRRALDVKNIPFTNHHFGVGDINPELKSAIYDSHIKQGKQVTDDEELTTRITRELHRLELAQVATFVDVISAAGCGVFPSGTRMLDAGSGRGGTSFFARCRAGHIGDKEYDFGIDGVTIANDQQQYATKVAEDFKIPDVKFHVQDMLKLSPPTFGDASYSHIFANETDMYILDLNFLYRRFYELLRPSSSSSASSFSLATWCNNAKFGKQNSYSAKIDDNYGTVMNTDEEILAALKKAGFRQIEVKDLTKEAIPYWELRNVWKHRSGVEKPFLEGYASDNVRYLMISATKS